MEPKKKPGGNNPFGGGPPPERKGDFRAFLKEMGIEWPVDDVVWDAWKPHPALELPEEVVFIGPGSGNGAAFSSADPITSGLQEAVAIFSGHITAAETPGVTFTPLLRTGHTSGIVRAGDVLQRSFFGVGGLNPRRARTLTADDYILAARVKGERAATGEGPSQKINAVFVADLDLVSSMFFDLRAQGREEFNFDNVTFVLNAVDVLAGDESVVALRKRRRVHRTLTVVEEQTRVHEERRMQETRVAEEEATRRLEEAQAALDARVEALRARADLDENTREIMVAAAQESENRRLAAATATIEAERGRAVRASGAEKETAVRGIQERIRLLAVLVPPLPALLLGFFVFDRRMKRERSATPERRRVEDVA
jgi:ABC-2 type transport system permease protein